MQKLIKQLFFIVGVLLSLEVNAQMVVDSLSAAYDNTDTAKVTINTNYACKEKLKSRLNIYFSIGALGDSIPTSFPVLTQTISPAPTSISTGDLLIYLQNKPVWMTGKGRRTITSINSPTTFSKDSLHKGYFKVKCVLTDACGNTVIRSKKGIIPPNTPPGVLSCTPCVFEPTVYSCVGGSGNAFYINNYDPLPMTFAGLPAIYKSSACGSAFNFKIRGIVNPVFPLTPIVWSGPGFGNTLIGSQPSSTCNGGLPAGQSNTYVVDTSGINVATLITATFNTSECGIQNISFYVLPDPPVITTTSVPITGVACPVVFPTSYNGICYTDITALLNQVRVDYPSFTITYNSGPCTFSFTGVDIPPMGIPLVGYTLSSVGISSSGISVPITFPVSFLGVSHSNSITLLAAVSAVYNSCPITLISLNQTTGVFTFEKDIASALPSNIPLVQEPYTTTVPTVGLSCPLMFPLVFNGIIYTSSGTLLSGVQALYPLHTITYNSLSCAFSFTGTTARPTSLTVSAVPSGTVPINGVSCPVSFPVDYLATTYNDEASLLAAVQAAYPAFTITYNNVSCLFTFTGIPTRPTVISLTPYVPPLVCLSPINVQFTEIASNGLIFSWVDGGAPPNDYKVEIFQGVTLVNTIYPATQGTVSYGGLVANTAYEVKITARCGTGDTDNKTPVSIFATTPSYPILRNAGYGVRQVYSTTSGYLGNYVDIRYTDPVNHALPAAAQNDYTPYGGPETITRMSDLLDITSTASVFAFPTGGTAFQYNLDEYLRFNYFENGNARLYYIYNTPLLTPGDITSFQTGVVGASTLVEFVDLVTYKANPFLGSQANDNTLTLLFNSFSGNITSSHVMEILDINNNVVATMTPAFSSPGGIPQTDFTLPANTAAYLALHASSNGKYQVLKMRLRNVIVPASFDFTLRVVKTRII